MTIDDFITSTLKDLHPSCLFCGGVSKSKGYTTRTYNHLPMAGTPSVIIWRRRRYICKDCGKTFTEADLFGPEAFQQTYAVLRSVADDLCNIHNSFKDIAVRHHISETLVELCCDSFVQVPRLSLPENLSIDEIHSDISRQICGNPTEIYFLNIFPTVKCLWIFSSFKR